MRAGRLRTSVVIERQSDTQDAMGQRIETWTAIATVRASIEPLRGKEFISASGERAELTTRIRVRHSSVTAAVRPRDRVNEHGVFYDIQSAINVDDRDKELQLMCKRVVDD